MLNRIRDQIGTAGLIVAVVALVAALGGAAVAANNDSSSGKNANATASAKGKKGPRGPKGPKGDTGPAGPAGAAGPKGDKGDAGAAGAAGTAGAAGAAGAKGATGVTGSTGATGATGVTGEAGSPWTAGGTLPSEETQTGSWTFRAGDAMSSFAQTAISFPIPLGSPLPEANTHVLNPNGKEVIEGGFGNEEVTPQHCGTGTAVNPQADPGHLCVYAAYFTANSSWAEFQPKVQRPDLTGGANLTPGAARTGALLNFLATSSTTSSGYGTFAVTAP